MLIVLVLHTSQPAANMKQLIATVVVLIMHMATATAAVYRPRVIMPAYS